MTSAYDTVVAYHQATKHNFDRYARSAGYMDWANQPNPFRFFEGAEKISLPLHVGDPELPYKDLHTPARGTPRPLTAESISSFLALSMGLSAWKKAGSGRWSLRINPSSGNLHPTEAHLVLPPAILPTSGVYHYLSFDHALEQRAVLPDEAWPRVESHFGGAGFLVALSTIFWRESWKYGERAYRYCNLDAGHAAAALSYAARLHNWQLTCLTGMGDGEIERVLGFDLTSWRPHEDEVPEMICWVSAGGSATSVPQFMPDRLVNALRRQSYRGIPNRLSSQAGDWPIIREVAEAAKKPETTPVNDNLVLVPDSASSIESPSAKIIHRRRSAVSYNPKRAISASAFFSILDPTLARPDVPPFGIRLISPSVHLLLFVHRVEGIEPGLYLLARRSDHVAGMRTSWRKEFLWQPVECGLPLYSLRAGDVTTEAKDLSCHQDIAGDGAFAASMLAVFETNLRRSPYLYRHLHWECGMIGQVLYLGAEAHGIRGTGIGCFFDDPVHRMLGIRDMHYQVLYHFTAGFPIEDSRLETLPAYHHLADDQR